MRVPGVLNHRNDVGSLLGQVNEVPSGAVGKFHSIDQTILQETKALPQISKSPKPEGGSAKTDPCVLVQFGMFYRVDVEKWPEVDQSSLPDLREPD